MAKHDGGILRATGQREAQTIVGGVDHGPRRFEEGEPLRILALRDADQRQLERDLGLVGRKGQRLAISASAEAKRPPAK